MKEETKELFEPHMIKASLDADFNSVLKSPEMEEFKKGLAFKSAISRGKDEALMNLLLNKMIQYKNGWIQANILSTTELWNKNLALDELAATLEPDKQKLIELSDEVNKQVNKIIVMFKDVIPDDTLNDLREMEKTIIKLKKQ